MVAVAAVVVESVTAVAVVAVAVAENVAQAKGAVAVCAMRNVAAKGCSNTSRSP